MVHVGFPLNRTRQFGCLVRLHSDFAPGTDYLTHDIIRFTTDGNRESRRWQKRIVSLGMARGFCDSPLPYSWGWEYGRWFGGLACFANLIPTTTGCQIRHRESKSPSRCYLRAVLHLASCSGTTIKPSRSRFLECSILVYRGSGFFHCFLFQPFQGGPH